MTKWMSLQECKAGSIFEKSIGTNDHPNWETYPVRRMQNECLPDFAVSLRGRVPGLGPRSLTPYFGLKKLGKSWGRMWGPRGLSTSPRPPCSRQRISVRLSEMACWQERGKTQMRKTILETAVPQEALAELKRAGKAYLTWLDLTWPWAFH